MPIAGLSSISSGRRHSCALGVDGAWCWGDNTSGQLGGGWDWDNTAPVMVLREDGTPFSEIKSVEAGGDFSCAVAGRDNSVYCWGDVVGQPGDFAYVNPTRVDGLLDVQSLSAGEYHVCAIENGGRASCWGTNSQGELGNGSTEDNHYPTGVRSE